MAISSIKISNYKSFRNVEIRLTKGVNLILGQNSVGKSAFLEAAGLNFYSYPHLSLLTVPNQTSRIDAQSLVIVEVSFTKKELVDSMKKLIRKGSRSSFYLPCPTFTSDFAVEIGYDDYSIKSNNRLIDWFNSVDHLVFKVSISNSTDSETNLIISPIGLSSMQLPYTIELNGDHVVSLGLKLDNNDNFIHENGFSISEDTGLSIINKLRSSISFIKAERMCSLQSKGGKNFELKSDGSNLPQVLGTLANTSNAFQRYLEFVKRVFPEIKDITFDDNSDGSLKSILVWYHDPKSERRDLAVPLAQCGTGVGQVLAMLYVITMTENTEVVLIDEPQTFLHSGALRRFMEIISEQSQHQYIISTHSPIVLATTNPSTVILLKSEKLEAKTQTLNTKDLNDIKLFMDEIGAKSSDLFGADSVLWVEGPTEEACYELLIKKVLKMPLLGRIIRGVSSTGSFEKENNVDTLFLLYKKLSSAGNIYPPAIGFLFDGECRTQIRKDDMTRTAKASANCELSFLDRRMYENYLLNHVAISFVLNKELPGEENKFSEEMVKEVLDKLAKEKKYFKDCQCFNQDDWVNHVHGASLLKDIFSQLTTQRLSYDKIQHGIMLTNFMIEQDPESFMEISTKLERILL